MNKLLLIALIIFGPTVFNAQTSSIIGSWAGDLMTPTAKIDIVLNFSTNAEGELRATLTSSAQGLKDLPLNAVNFAENLVRFELKAAGAVFEGRLSGDEITGKWSQGGQSAPLNFKRQSVNEPTKPLNSLKRQTPQAPFPYKSEEVTFENRSAGVKLAGTLTLPRAPTPVPAVILLSVAGPNDRDMLNGGHRHFLVLADFLTQQGFAVLRFDDRGVGGSTGDLFRSTISDFADDALAGLAYLQSRPEIDRGKIGFLGNSEGAAVASLAAARSVAPAFVIMLAGPGLTGAEIIRKQTETLAKRQGLSSAETRRILKLGNDVFEILKNETDDQKAAQKLRALSKKNPVTPLFGASLLGTNDLEAQIRLYVSPWYRAQIVFDPKTFLSKVKCPVLAMNGELDTIMDAPSNLRAIQSILSESGNSDYTIVHLPKLNHIFQTAKTGLPNEYRSLEESFSPRAMKIIADWLVVRFVRPE